jgi:hypothetical protein
MPEVTLNEARAGDSIAWQHGGYIELVLAPFLALFDRSWRKRLAGRDCEWWQIWYLWGFWKRPWPWHTGYIVKILDSGEVVTSQAVAKGVEPITYPSINDLGDCKIYRWLKDPDSEKIDQYTSDHEGDPYDFFWGYFSSIVGGICMFALHRPFRIVDVAKMCWENVSQMNRYCGREIQREEEPVLISRMVNAWEGS